jgi:hypothetical protein
MKYTNRRILFLPILFVLISHAWQRSASAQMSSCSPPQSQADVFNDTRMNQHNVVNVNDLNFLAQYHATNGLHATTSAGTFGINVPASSTVMQADGVEGFCADATTSATYCVAGYFNALRTAGHGAIWALNPLVQASTFGNMTGMEIDLNSLYASDPFVTTNMYPGSGGISANGADINGYVYDVLNLSGGGARGSKGFGRFIRLISGGAYGHIGIDSQGCCTEEMIRFQPRGNERQMLFMPNSSGNFFPYMGVTQDTGTGNRESMALIGLTTGGTTAKWSWQFCNTPVGQVASCSLAEKASIDQNGNLIVHSVTGLTAPILPSAPGSTSVGSDAAPFSSVFIGDAATRSIRITGTATQPRTMKLGDGNQSSVLSTSFTTTAAPSDNVTVIGATALSHCWVQPTDSGAAGLSSVFVSRPSTNQITVNHQATAGSTFNVFCTPD